MNKIAKVNGHLVFEWVTRNSPPLTWSNMAVRLGEDFLDNGVNPFHLDENEVFDGALLITINQFLNNYYGIQLPDFND